MIIRTDWWVNVLVARACWDWAQEVNQERPARAAPVADAASDADTAVDSAVDTEEDAEEDAEEEVEDVAEGVEFVKPAMVRTRAIETTTRFTSLVRGLNIGAIPSRSAAGTAALRDMGEYRGRRVNDETAGIKPPDRPRRGPAAPAS
ncbi:hypothetical protein ACIQVO_10775 [Streptomyces sp. NPDC101062]|uniref:hypothetical protein n=1 Tax=unclassified Streptomyces TaxID=2593676 RepID=UPI0038034FB3